MRLVDFIASLRANRLAAGFVAVLVFASLAVVSLLDTPVYRAYATLGPAAPLVNPDRVSLTEELIGFGLGGMPEFDVFQARTSATAAFALLNSQAIARRYIESENLLPVLFAELWDAENGAWVSSDPARQPTMNDALDIFMRDVRFLSRSPATGFVRINVEWPDPRLAAEWANGLAELTDEAIRERDIREAQEAIEFLKSRAESAPLESVRQLIFALIESYTKTIVVANVKDNYAFTVIDPAVPPGPDEAINMPISFRLSLALLCAIGAGLVWVYVVHLLERLRVSGHAE